MYPGQQGQRELQDFLFRELASFIDKRHIDILIYCTYIKHKFTYKRLK